MRRKIVALPSFNPIAGTNTIDVEVVNINSGASDENLANNSVYQELEYSVGFTSINVSILTDDYGYETYWEIRNGSGTVVISGGNPAVGINGGGQQTAGNGDPGAYEDNTLYEESYLVPSDGCYEFEIVDDYGDGVCCDFGSGNYSVTDVQGSIIASGGAFGSSEETITGMQAVLSVNEINTLASNLYPNPANDELFIEFDQLIPEMRIQMFNQMGQLVLTDQAANQQIHRLDISELSKGIYSVYVLTDLGSVSKKVIIK